MALCPECGGKISPAELLKAWPSATVPCRWCRAKLQIPGWSRIVVGGTFLAGAAGAGAYLGTSYLKTGDLLPLILLAGFVLGWGVLMTLIQWLLPLRTLVPRDYRDWKAAEERAAPAATLEAPATHSPEDQTPEPFSRHHG